MTTTKTMQKTLPKGWKMVKLGEVAKIVSGSTPSTSDPAYWDGDITWVTPADLSKLDTIEINNSERKITTKGYQGCSTTMLPAGTVLFSSRAPIGHLAIAGKEMCTNQGFKSLIPNEKTNSFYLFFILKHFKERLISLGSGATFKEISKTSVEKFEIPLPPLPTQHKIVEILEEADNLRKFRQQADEKMKDLIPSLFVQMFGDPAINPKKWSIKKLEEVCTKITDGSHRTPKLLDKGYPFLTVTNLRNGSFDFSDVKYISDIDYKDLIKNDCKPLKGDVLFSKDGTIGKVVEIKEEKEFVILSSLAILRPQPKIIHSTYLAKIALTDFFINQAKEKQSGSALRRIILRSLKSVKIPLPPLPLQQEFAKLVEDIEAEKARQAESKKKLDELFQSLMQRAFTGELAA